MRPIRYACESARIYKIYVTASWYTPPRALHYTSLSHERPIRYASQSLIRFLTFFLSFFLSSFLSLRQVYVRHGYVCIWLILWMMRDMMQWYERHDSWEREREIWMWDMRMYAYDWHDSLVGGTRCNDMRDMTHERDTHTLVCETCVHTGLCWKRALQKRPIFCKETYNFKRPANHSHPILYFMVSV